jgi:sialic acid synthase SpsE
LKSTIFERAQKGEFVLIAEIGVNYYDIALKLNISVMDAAKLMIREAKNAGIHAVKFQSYKAETLAAKNSPSYWNTTEEVTSSQFALFKKFDSFSYEQYAILSKFSLETGIEFLSTPFDFASVDYLENLMGVYKISSSDLNNIPFVEYIAKKNKPILLSVGASNESEIDTTLQVIRNFNNQPLAVLHCVLEYPTSYEHANLNKIKSLKNKYFDYIVGYSDHTKPNMDVIKTAYNLGAIIVEKHFTLDKTLSGNDHYHAMDPEDARNILDSLAFINKLRGSYDIHCLDSELLARQNARRSLVSACNIAKGTIITSQMLTFKRPGTGIPPTEIKKIIGKTAMVDIFEDTILQNKMFR